MLSLVNALSPKSLITKRCSQRIGPMQRESRWKFEAETIDDVQSPTLPWIHEEELIAGHKHFPRTQQSSGLLSALRVVVAVVGMAAFAAKMLNMSPKVSGGSVESKVDRYLI